MTRAVWNGVVIAASEDVVIFEGNHYFPADSLDSRYFARSRSHTLCLWKGVASYIHVEVGGRRNRNAAWHYPRPWLWGRKLRERVAFRHGVTIEP